MRISTNRHGRRGGGVEPKPRPSTSSRPRTTLMRRTLAGASTVLLGGASLLVAATVAEAQVPPAPSIDVTKTVYEGHDAGIGCPGTELATGQTGDDVTYCFVVTNDGDTPLAPVTLTDASLEIDDTDMSVVSGSLASMAPGDSATLYVESTVDGDLVNSVTADGVAVDDVGDPLVGVDPVSDVDTAEVREVDQAMTLLTEVRDPFSGAFLDADSDTGTPGSNDGVAATFAVGDTATFRFTVTNAGDAPITDVLVDAPQCQLPPILASGDGGDAGVLEEDEIWVHNCVVTDLTESVTMLATVTGNVDGEVPDGSGDSESARAQVASVTLEKTVESPDTGEFTEVAVVESGEDATFQIVVTNDGDAPLSGVSVTDSLAPDCEREFDETLPPGESFAAYTCLSEGVDGGFVNTASVIAEPVDAQGNQAGEMVEDDDTAVVEVSVGVTTDLAMDKQLVDVDQGDGVDGTATWELTVTNVGGTLATEPMVVTDDLPAALGFRKAESPGWSCESLEPTVTCVSDADLEPGESSSFLIETYVFAGNGPIVTNVASVDAIDDSNPDNNQAEAFVAVDQDGVPFDPDDPYDTFDYADAFPDELARTGSDPAGLLLTGGLLIVAGAALMMWGRRVRA